MQSGSTDPIAFDRLEGWRGWRVVVDFDRLATPGAAGRSAVATRRVVSFGELLRADALARELGVDPRGSDRHEKILLAGYERWGTGLFARLLGEVGIGVWDAPEHTLIAATDPWGSLPVYYAQFGSKVAVATDTRALWALPWVGDEVDDETIVAWLVNATPGDDATFYRNIKRLPGGHVLVANGGRIDVRRYWGPHFPDQGLRTAKEFEEAFRETLFDAVRARLEGTDKVTIVLSGGFDSTSLAAAAAQIWKEPGMPEIRTISAVFPGLPCDESKRIALARSVLPFEGEVFEPVAAGITEADMRADVERYDAPFVNQQRAFTGDIARRAQTSALIWGTGGDELVVDWDFEVDLRRTNGLLGLPRTVRQVQRATGSGAFTAARNVLKREPPRWLRRSYWRARLGAGSSPFRHVLEPRWGVVARQLQAPSAARRAGFETHTDMMRWSTVTDPASQRWRHWLRIACENTPVRAPFFDCRLTEVIQCTPAQIRPKTTDNALFKPILVQATGHLLPTELTRWRWKADFSPYHARVQARTLPHLQSDFDNDVSWDADAFVGRMRAIELLRRCTLTADTFTNILGERMFRVLALDRWLKLPRAVRPP